MVTPREASVAEAFVSLASALVRGYDLVDLLTELTEDCARLLDVAEAGILLADGESGQLFVVAASSAIAHDLETHQLLLGAGPCFDCYYSGAPVTTTDIGLDTRWPAFSVAALSRGFRSVHAVPMRLQDRRLGGLNLFGSSTGALNGADLVLAQAFADVATVAILQDQVVVDSRLVTAQLQHALTSRVQIEQAKGILSVVGGVDMNLAFAHLRTYSRAHSLRMADVVQSVIDNSLDPRDLVRANVDGQRPRQRTR